MSEEPINIPGEIQISISREPLFRKYVYGVLEKDGNTKEEDLINSGAETARISTVTAKRYLAKMCSSEGMCMMFYWNGRRYIKLR